jgi:uncharacterized membrane protein YbhN (UPF0104 family)
MRKNAVKWIVVLMFVGAIVYTFRDSAGTIFEQLKTTSPVTIIVICLMSAGYELMEGSITTLLAKEYYPSFRYVHGIINAFQCSFYRVATLGSGTGVAATVYLGECGLEYAQSLGLYMLQYAFHKIGIAIFSGVMFLVNYSYMMGEYGEYMGLLVGGYAVTVLITLALILFCCSRRFHIIIFAILKFVNSRLNNRLKGFTLKLQSQCDILEAASERILKSPRLIFNITVLNQIRNCFWYAIPYAVFWKTGLVTLSQAMATTSLSVMLAAVIPAPAGIGSTEFVFTSLFASAVGSGAAISAALLYRFATFVVPFLAGGVIVIMRQLSNRKQ